MSRPADRAALTAPALLAAVLLASPALFRALVQDLVPLSVALERLALITLGCLAVAYVAPRLLPAPGPGADAGAGSAGRRPGAGAGSDVQTVTDGARGVEGGADLASLDAPATSLLDGLDDLDGDLFDTDLLDSAQLALEQR